MDDSAGVVEGDLGLHVQVVDHDASGQRDVGGVDLGPDVQPGGGPDAPWPVQGHHDQHGDQLFLQKYTMNVGKELMKFIQL